MARPLTAAEREELGPRAYEMSVRGHSQRAIAAELGVSRATVAGLLEEQRKHRRRERSETPERVLDGIDAAISECWRRLERLPPYSAANAAPGLLNALNSLHRTKTEILGFKAPTKTQSKLAHSYEPWDLSRLSDEELEQMHALSRKAYRTTPPGRLYALGENALDEPYGGAGAVRGS